MPTAVTASPFWSSEQPFVPENVVALLAFTTVPLTVIETARHVPVKPEIAPETVTSTVVGAT